MRWFWIDQFTEFVAETRATAIKCVSLSEEVVDDYAPGWPHFPAALIVEGFAQTGGLLVSQMSDFKNRVVLAKVGKCSFNRVARPGDRLELKVTIDNLQPNGAMVSGVGAINGEPHSEVDLMFAYLEDERFKNVELFEPAELCRMCRMLRVFEVGVYPDGSPVLVPEHMLEAEKQILVKSAV